MKHWLGQRQLKDSNLSRDKVPTLEEWRLFTSLVDQAYLEFDRDRDLLERSLSKSSKEMEDRWMQLQELEAKWRSFVFNVPDVILTLDSNLVVEFSNRQTGLFSSGLLVGSSYLELFPLEKRDGIRRQLEYVLKHDEMREFDCEIISDGKVEHYSMRVGMVPKQGSPSSIIIVKTNITEKIESEKIIKEQQTQIISAAKLSNLGEMAAGVAHEINNPLTIIYSTAESALASLSRLRELEKEAASPVDSKLIKILSTVNRIVRIIRGLRSFAREVENDPLEVRHVGTIIQEVFDFYQARLSHHSIEVLHSMVPQEAFIKCRPTQIGQVLLNLLSNAFDALENQEERWIKIDVEVSGGFVKILVSDSGVGISPDAVEKIMQPFYTTKDVGKGTGLGLSISKGIIESHRGKLFLNASTPHTQFEIHLPLVEAPATVVAST